MYDEYEIKSQVIGTSGNVIDLTALNSKIKTATYKHITVSFNNQNNVANAYCEGSATRMNTSWYVHATATVEAYYTLHLRCWK